MSPVEDNLSYQLGLLTASIDASRTDANRRFDTLVSSIGENKKIYMNLKIKSGMNLNQFIKSLLISIKSFQFGRV
jgi:uncharacterized protein YktA (UPF0223 family)